MDLLPVDQQCEHCACAVSGVLHTCPYDEALNSDIGERVLCNCCADCQLNCQEDT